MDFSNSTMGLEQSGQQQIGFLIKECKIDVYSFWEKKGIKPIATLDSAKELTYQTAPNLFYHSVRIQSRIFRKKGYVSPLKSYKYR